MPYGPDNKNQLFDNQIAWIKVPPGCRAEFSFSSNAAWENAVCIYSQNSVDKLVEKGNSHGRNLNEYATPENNTHQDTLYRVTGWHKEGSDEPRYPWIQSGFRTLINENNARVLTYGFEDSGGSDYDDMIVSVKIVN